MEDKNKKEIEYVFLYEACSLYAIFTILSAFFTFMWVIAGGLGPSPSELPYELSSTQKTHLYYSQLITPIGIFLIFLPLIIIITKQKIKEVYLRLGVSFGIMITIFPYAIIIGYSPKILGFILIGIWIIISVILLILRYKMRKKRRRIC